MTPGEVAGLLLAAGSGSRLGRPKALLADAAGVTFLERALHVLQAGGCDPVYVVLGAGRDDVRPHVPVGVHVVVAEDWAEGMGTSLRAGLGAVTDAEPAVTAVVVMLVDTPGAGADVVRRLVGSAVAGQPAATTAPGTVASALARAAYDGVPAHPVLIGRDHWWGVTESAGGDRGARDYLQAHRTAAVECGDIGSGADIDTLGALDAWQARQNRRT